MKVKYKGFEIEVNREMSLAGWSMLYYTVYHIEDGWFLKDSFEDSEETVRDKIKQLKGVVDDYIENPEIYEEDGYDWLFEDTYSCGCCTCCGCSCNLNELFDDWD